MTFQQISQRGKKCLKTAETVLRAAQIMADRAVAGQLKALADDCERRAEMLMRPRHSLDRLLTLKHSGVHDAIGSIPARPAEGMRGEAWDARGAAQSRAFYPVVTACRASKLWLTS
jgi:hypothetical protein